MSNIKFKHILVVLQIPILAICMKLSATERPSFCDEAAYVENGYLLVSGNADSTDETDAREKAFANAEKEIVKYFNGSSRIREIESVRTDTQKFRGVYSVCRLFKVRLIEKDKEKVVKTDTGSVIEVKEYTEIEVIDNEQNKPEERQPTLIVTTEPLEVQPVLALRDGTTRGFRFVMNEEGQKYYEEDISGYLYIAKQGYKLIKVSEKIYLKKGKTLRMHFKLTPAPGTVITPDMFKYE